MTDYVKEVFDFIERAPRAILQAAIVCLALAGCLHGASYIGLIKLGAVGGYLPDAIGILYSCGAAFIASAAAFSVMALPKKIAARISSFRTKNKETRRIDDNLNYAPDGSLVILLMALHQPNGRFPSYGDSYPSMGRLTELDLVVDESGYFNFATGRMVNVHPHLWKNKKRVIESLHERLRPSAPQMRLDRAELEMMAVRVIEDENRRGRIRI